MKFSEAGTEFVFDTVHADKFEAWKEDSIVTIAPTKGGFTILLTHGSADGTLSNGAGRQVTPRQLLDSISEQYAPPTQDVYILCCYPGAWDDFEYQGVQVHSIGEWNCTTTLKSFEAGDGYIAQIHPTK